MREHLTRLEVELTEQELWIIYQLLGERLAEKKNKATTDLGKYVEMSALRGKVEGLLDLRRWEG